MITPEERAAARRELIEARADGRVAAALEELSHPPLAYSGGIGHCQWCGRARIDETRCTCDVA